MTYGSGKAASMRAWTYRVLFAASLVLPMSALAQSSVAPEEEYKKFVKVSDDIQPLGDTPFGERINLYDGTLAFYQVDVTVPGTGPTITIGREFRLHDTRDSLDLQNLAFGDWELALPQIDTVTANQRNVTGWIVSGANPKDVCTSFNAPPTVAQSGLDRPPWTIDQWWQGYQLHVPGQGNQELLARSPQNTASPSSSFIQFSFPNVPIVTVDDWSIGCVQHASTDPTTQSFLAVAPDGTRYWLDHLSYRYLPTLTRPLLSASAAARANAVLSPQASTEDVLVRRQGRMLVTRVQDRFGNWVSYGYSGDQVTDITASDGRHVTLAYDGGTPRITRVIVQGGAAGTRTWSYGYAQVNGLWELSSIGQPDGSTWSFNMTGLDNAWVDMRGNVGSCEMLPNLNFGSSSTFTGTMVHPSGLTGTFTVMPVRHGRSNVPQDCQAGVNQSTAPTNPGTWASIPDAYYGLTILQRQLSGTGLGIGGTPGTQTWNYSYSPSNESWSKNCANGCASTVWTKVIFPDGHAERSSFSNRYDYTEAKLLSEEVFDGDVDVTTRRRLVQYAYVNPNPAADGRAAAYPHPWGFPEQQSINTAASKDKVPMASRTITQDGDTYTWNALSFDAFGRAHDVQRFNSVGFSVHERNSYFDDAPHWVVDLPSQTDNVSAGETVSRYVYNAADQTLLERYRFGRKVMGYTYDAQGQLSSFTDGNSHTTSLQNYYRGIPRAILYPDGTAQTLAVDDFGQVTAIANQKGDVTGYGYDGIGRLSTIVYPSGDSTAWNTTNIVYNFMPSGDRNISGAHWRRTRTEGTKVSQTYYDAMLRPIVQDVHRDDNALYASNRTDYDWRGRQTYHSYWFSGAPFLQNMSNGQGNTYDVLDRLTMTRHTSEIGDLVTTTAYLPGARKQVVDPKGHSTVTSYQSFDEPAWEDPVRVEAPENVVQTIVRDTYGNPLSISQGGAGQSLTRTMAYDGEHRLCRTWSPESGSEILAYDNADNQIWSVQGASFNGTGCGQDQVADAAKTTRGYDARNRITSIVYPAGTQPTTYTYDPLGNPATATSGTNSWTFGRNKRGLLTSEHLSIDGHEWTLGYGYDANGVESSVTYPDGEVVAYNPDAVGHPTTVGGYVSGLSMFMEGQIQFYRMGSGATYIGTKNLRDTIGKLTFNTGGTTPVVAEDLSLDADGNIAQIADTATGGQRSKIMSYDGLDRLVSATASNLWGTESYAYDTLDNIRSLSNAGGTNTYNYDPSNLLVSITNGAAQVHAFRYDGRGNLAGRDGANLNFDQANRLVSIDGKGSYTYDAAGHRVKKVTPAGTTYYAYSAEGKLMWEYQASTGAGTDYIYLSKKLIAKHSGDGSGVSYLYTDLLGTVLAITDAAGNLRATNDYRPYGQPALGAPGDGPGYAGHVEDSDSGLVYMQARYFDPASGRFVSTDPKSVVPGGSHAFSLYAYANDNPYRFVDPDGWSPGLLGDMRRSTRPYIEEGRRFITKVARFILDRGDKTEVSVDGQVGFRTVGLSASKSLYNGTDSFSGSRSGEAGLSAEVSAHVKMEVLSVDFAPGTDTSRVSYVGHLSAYDGIGGGVEVKANLGGKLSVSLIAGTGAGESAWGSEISSDVEKTPQQADQDDRMRDADVRRQIGIPPPAED